MNQEILDNCRLFSAATGRARQKLLDMAKTRTYARGEIIFRQDDAAEGTFIVGDGLVRIYKLAPSGKEHVLHLAGPGQTFLEVAAILEMNCPAFAEALEDTVCLLLPAVPFRRALKEDHQLCLELLSGMAVRVRHLVGLLEDIVLRDALARVAKYLLTEQKKQGAEISLPGLKKHLASHLNLTSETLSRCLRQLLDAGIAQTTENQNLRLLKPDQLQDAADGLFPTL